MKIAPDTAITERKGINLIERRVLDMRHIWHPTTTVDSGIDGEIELRAPSTGEVLNVRIGVQSKATTKRFPGEDDNGFHYIPSPRDIEYWLAGTRTILVCSRPSTDQAYWIDVTDWASDPQRLRSRKIHFDKRRDIFDQSAADRLRMLSGDVHPDIAAGTAASRHETLITNLLPLVHVSDVLFSAAATHESRHEASDALVAAGLPPRKDWLLRDGNVWSLCDLTDPGFVPLLAGPVGESHISVWSAAEEPSLRNAFAHLLLCTLSRPVER